MGGLATNRFVSDDLQADYSRKAAFTSLQDMMTRLRGMQFKDRIASEPADFVLTFGGGGRQLIAAWTAGEAREAVVNGATVLLTSRPVYFQPRQARQDAGDLAALCLLNPAGTAK